MGRAQQGSYSLLDLGPFIPNLGGERVGALVAASFGILAVYGDNEENGALHAKGNEI